MIFSHMIEEEEIHCTFLPHTQRAMEQIDSYSEAVCFGINFLEKSRKVSPLKNLRKD